MSRSSAGGKERIEWLKCRARPTYFLDRYGWVYDATARTWLPFRLWPSQREALAALDGHRLSIALKARQLGLTWLVVGYGLWQMLFRPQATLLLFSKRDDEAVHLLASRLRGMYRRLPAWLRCRDELKVAAHEWRLSNGSTALAFPTTGGRSYTATLAIVDEADFAPDLGALLNAVKPTIDAGGRLILLSTADKSRPESEFKRLYWAAKAGAGGWSALFLPWSARPGRDAAWYDLQRADVLARTGFLDDLYQEYPATDLEALAPRTADVRFAAAWLAACADEREGGATAGVPGLAVYEEAAEGAAYVIGADPAEGNPQSDESAATVLDCARGAEVASLAGRFDPAVFAGHLARLSRRFNEAPVLVERNNHGHAVLLALAERGEVICLDGRDGKPGWLTTAASKSLAYDHAAERFAAHDALIRSPETLRQLQGIRGSTLAAAEGEHDDRAMAYVLALAALKWGGVTGGGQMALIAALDPIAEADRGGF